MSKNNINDFKVGDKVILKSSFPTEPGIFWNPVMEELIGLIVIIKWVTVTDRTITIKSPYQISSLDQWTYPIDYVKFPEKKVIKVKLNFNNHNQKEQS